MRVKRTSLYLLILLTIGLLASGLAACRSASLEDDWLADEFYEPQIYALLDRSTEFSWQPLYMSSLVLVADRSLTDRQVHSYADLLAGQELVGLSLDQPDFRLIYAALPIILGQDQTSAAGSSFLRELYQADRLLEDLDQAAFMIMFDHQAAARIKQGQKLEIIIPREGIVSFPRGFLTTDLQLAQDYGQAARDLQAIDQLIDQGLRSLDGRADPAIYPPAAAYQAAQLELDYETLNRSGQKAMREYRRQVQQIRHFTSADTIEHMATAAFFIVLVILWTALMLRRILSQHSRLIIFTAAACLVLWTIVRIFKYQLPATNPLSRYLWYSYYIFQLGLPVLLLRLAAYSDRPEPRGLTRTWQVIIAINFFLLLAVFTNDWHQLIFRFDLASWSDNYRYAPTYYLLLAINLLIFLAAILLLFHKTKNSPRKKALLIPFFFTLSLLVYIGAYIKRISWAWESDFTITFGFFVLLFMQSAVHSGLIPLNSKYVQLFAASPLSMQLVDKNNQLVLSSASRSQTDLVALDLRKAPLAGGYVQWYEDLSVIRTLQEDLQNTVRLMEKTNQILQNQYHIRADLEKAQAAEKIMAELDLLVSSGFETIEDKLAQVSNQASNLNPSDKKHLLYDIAFLLSYIKRRCNFLFWRKQADSIAYEELAAFLDELCNHAQDQGLTVAFLATVQGNIRIDAAIIIYSFLFDGLRFAVANKHEELIIYLSPSKQDLSLTMQLLSDQAFDQAFAGETSSYCQPEISAAGYLHQAKITLERGLSYV